MMAFDEVRKILGDRLRSAREAKRWSYVQVADEIDKQGGNVSAKTVENIEKGNTAYEFGKLYWVARVLGLNLGEALDFTVRDEDKRAHALLSSFMRRGKPETDHMLTILKFLNR